jgi:hypothetical protein
LTGWQVVESPAQQAAASNQLARLDAGTRIQHRAMPV